MTGLGTRLAAAALIALSGLSLTGAKGDSDRKTPYWASIAANNAMMRTGPGRNYPATWRYVRADLPIKVIETYPDWRKVQDPDGTTGWMLVRLLSDTRTAIVRGSGAQPMHEAPDAGSRIRYHAQPGVVGRLSRCAAQWCRFDAGGRQAYIRTANLWGVDGTESID